MSRTPPMEVDSTTLYKVLAAASIGNFVEWFDFAAYGYLATILAHEFFPSDGQTIAIMKTFAIFAVAFTLRPLGAVVFGVLGDRIGRKRTLALTILMMATSTTLIGLLPVYHEVGVLAPLLLTIIRCVQGFSAGGEYAGACAYVMEHAPRRQRAKFGSYIPVSTFSSFAVAAVVAYGLTAILSPHAMAGWGWRVPFLAAAPVGLIGLYLRLGLDETPAFQAIEAEQKRTHSHLLDTLKTQKGKIIRLGAFISLTALSFYTFTTYFATYMQVAGRLSRSASLLITVFALAFAAALCPLAGLYADAVGRRKTMMTACIALIVTVYPSLSLARSGNVALAGAGAAMLAISAVLSGVVTAPLLSEVFPTKSRYTASAITYNLAYTIFGGTAPLVATYLIARTGSTTSPALYIIVISILGLAGGITLPETSRVSLHGNEGAALDVLDSPSQPKRNDPARV